MTGTEIAALAIAAVAVFWMVGAYNRLTRLRNDIGSAWSQFDAQLQRRAAALPVLLDALDEPMAAERPALDAVRGAEDQVRQAAEALRTAPLRPERAAALVIALAQLDSALARLLALLEQHPALREIEAVGVARRELHDVDLRLAFARQLFNGASEIYNTAIEQFPTRVLTGFFRFGPAGRL